MSDDLKQFLQILACFVWGLLAIASSASAFNDGGLFHIVAGLVNLAGAGFGIYLYLKATKDKL